MFGKNKNNSQAATILKNGLHKKDSNRLFIKRLAIHPNNGINTHIGFKKIYILPTQKGLFYFVTLAIMFVWTVNYALSLGYAMTFFVGILGLLLSVLTVNNLAKITISATTQNHFFSGSPAFFSLKITNEKKEPAIQLTTRRNGIFSKTITLESNSQDILEVPLDDNSRGIKQLDYFRLSTDYPVGIFRAWTWLKMDIALLIYPCPKGDLALPFVPEHKGIDEGQIDSHGAEDLHDLKDYHPGDNIRHIVWKKISQGQVRVKSFQDLAGQECILDFNDPSLKKLNVEDKLSQLCQWVLLAEQQGSKYALYLPNKKISFGIGTNHQAQCLEALACY